MNGTQSKAQALAAALIAAGFDTTIEDDSRLAVVVADDFRIDIDIHGDSITVEALAVFYDREIGWDSTTVAVDSYATEGEAVEAVLKHRKDYQDEVERVVAEERAYDAAMAAAGLTA